MTQFRSIFTAILLFSLLAFQSACTVEVELEDLKESEVVEIIEASLQEFAGGLTSNIQDIAEEITEAISSGALCDTAYTQSVEENYQRGQIQSNYSTEMTYEMSCNELNKPASASFSSSTEYSYSTLRLSADDEANFEGNISGLLLTDPNLALEGNYASSGNQELNFNTSRSLGSTFNANLTNFQVDKSSFDILSGTATFTFTGTLQDTEFTYSGSITFNSDGTAKLDLNGNTYSLDLN
ncbi:MAG: hypothetical protein AAF696_28975 [Bacteroidota bacterium]